MGLVNELFDPAAVAVARWKTFQSAPRYCDRGGFWPARTCVGNLSFNPRPGIIRDKTKTKL